MQILFDRLSKPQRDRVRSIARDAYLYHRGRPDEAKRLASENIKAEFVASSIITAIAVKLLVAVAINLASKLIARWALHQLSAPASRYVAGEPGYIE